MTERLALALEEMEPGEDDPVGGMAPLVRQTPRGRSPHAWEPDGFFSAVVYPTRDEREETLPWRAFVLYLGDTYEDVLNVRSYVFPCVGTVARQKQPGQRMRLWTAKDVRRAVLRRYAERLRLAGRLFGVRWDKSPLGARQAGLCVPGDVALAVRLLNSAAGRREPWGYSERLDYARLRHAFVAEGAHFVYWKGPSGLRTLEATLELGGVAGVLRLLRTWWRLP